MITNNRQYRKAVFTTKAERDAVISDQIMRLLVTTADHLTDEEIAAFDDRKGLDTEAKLRAEQGAAEEDSKSSTVRLGAPVKEAAPAPVAEEAPAADAPAEGGEEAPAAE